MIQPEKHLEHLQRTFMDKNQMLCIPFFDFEHDEPVSEEILECLCEAGLNGMQDGWLNGMVFEGNGMMGVGFPADRRVRNWIAEAGDIEI